jgi:hypothetical protein
MKAYTSSSSNIHSDDWTIFYLLIIYLTAPILLTMMMQSRAPHFASRDDLLQRPIPTQNIARSRREGEVEEIEELEISVVIDMDSIQAEVRPLCSNYPLASINSQPLPEISNRLWLVTIPAIWRCSETANLTCSVWEQRHIMDFSSGAKSLVS